MKRVVLRKAGEARPVAGCAWLAERFWSRARGLLGRPQLRADEAFILRPCKAIHTWGMSYAIDVLFVDPAGMVIASYSGFPPNRRTRWYRASSVAVELPFGAIREHGVAVGDHLSWETQA